MTSNPRRRTPVLQLLRWILFSVFIASMTLTLVGLSVDILYHFNLSPQIASWKKKVAHYREPFLKDQEFFSTHPFFGNPLNPDQNPNHPFPNIDQVNKLMLNVPLGLQKKVLALGEQWLERRYLAPVPPAIENFFSNLQPYNQWNYKESQAQGVPRLWIISGQLFLIHLIDREGQNIETQLMNFRHYVKLLFSSHQFNLKLAALSLLSKEKEFLRFLRLKMPEKNVQWKTISESDLSRFRFHLYQTYDFFDFLTPAKMIQEFFIKTPLPLGVCDVYHLKMAKLNQVWHPLAAHFPFEPFFFKETQAMSRLTQQIEQSCQNFQDTVTIERTFTSYIPFFRKISAVQFMLSNKSLAQGTSP